MASGVPSCCVIFHHITYVQANSKSQALSSTTDWVEPTPGSGLELELELELETEYEPDLEPKLTQNPE